MEVIIRILVDIAIGWNLFAGVAIEGTDKPSMVGEVLTENRCGDVFMWEVSYDEDGNWTWRYYEHSTGKLTFDYINKSKVYWLYCSDRNQ